MGPVANATRRADSASVSIHKSSQKSARAVFLSHCTVNAQLDAQDQLSSARLARERLRQRSG